MTAIYATTEEVAANALQICDDLRTQYLPGMFEGLARECVTYPARMAQVLMCLAVWVDYEAPMSSLGVRAQAVQDARSAAVADLGPLHYIPLAGEA